MGFALAGRHTTKVPVLVKHIDSTRLVYRPDIDGLRAIAVLAVVFHHLLPSAMPGGYVGVDVFFVISGYLITGILRKEILAATFTFARFYERRARRILPALFVVLLATLAASYVLLLPSDLSSTLRAAAGATMFVSNIVFWRDLAAGYFVATDASLNPLLHTWSLAVEEQYYILFPLVLLALHRFAPRFVVTALCCAALVSLFLSVAWLSPHTVAVFFLAPFRAWELLVGALLAYGVVPKASGRWPAVIATVGLVAILLPCALYTPDTPFPGLAALAPVIGAAMIIHAGTGSRTAVGSLLSRQLPVTIGAISYSLYLWHWPVAVLSRYGLGLSEAPATSVLIFLASAALAALSYRFVEQPFRKPRTISLQRLFRASLACAVAVVAVSATGLATGGFPQRFSREVVGFDQARSPIIPFLQCQGLAIGHACTVGARQAPTTLFWGDSHILAWAPAFDDVMNELGQSGILATVSACPPMLGLRMRKINVICQARNSELRAFLQSHEEVHTVVLGAYWPLYFEGPDGDPAKALESTLTWLQSMRRDVVVLGPVPIYKASVPFARALEAAGGKSYLRTTQDDQQGLNSEFFKVVERAHVRMGNPIAWLCQPQCALGQGDAVFYRDSNHLSAAGAKFLEPQIKELLRLPTQSQSPGNSASTVGGKGGSSHALRNEPSTVVRTTHLRASDRLSRHETSTASG